MTKKLAGILILVLLLGFPAQIFAQEINSVPLGKDHRGNVIDESVTKTPDNQKTKVIEEVLEKGVGGSDETINTISQESSTGQKNIFVIIGETVARIVETIFPFLKNEPTREPPKMSDLIIHSLIGAVFPPRNIVGIFQDGFKPQVAPKQENSMKSSSPLLSPRTSSSSDVKVIDNTKHNLEISDKKLSGWPDQEESIKKKVIGFLPDANFRTHKGRSAIDLLFGDKTEVYATMDGTVTFKIDGNGLNTWPYSDKDGNAIPYKNNGKTYYKCDASQDDYENKVCGVPTYGISAQLVNKKNNIKIVYAHLSKSTFDHLKEKVKDLNGLSFDVRKDDLIGLTNNAGYSSEPHLHYEVWEAGKPLLSDKERLNECLQNSLNENDEKMKLEKRDSCWYDYNKENLNLMGLNIQSIKD
jgi:hypothetical protein